MMKIRKINKPREAVGWFLFFITYPFAIPNILSLKILGFNEVEDVWDDPVDEAEIYGKKITN